MDTRAGGMIRPMTTPAQRSAELTPPNALAPLRAEAIEQVARWRVYRGGDTLHRPEPLLTELYGESAARWCDELDGSSDDGLPEDAVRVGFDADGRPLIARAMSSFGGGEGRHHLIRYGTGLDGADELIFIRWGDDNRRRVVVIDVRRDEAGRVVETRDDEDAVVSYSYDDDGRVAERVELIPKWGHRIPHECEYDERGELARIVRPDLGRGVDWEAIRDRHEPQLPPPEELAEQVTAGIVDALAAGIAAAARELPQPVYALLSLRGSIEPSCVVVDRAAVASLVAHEPDLDAPLRLGGDDPGTAEVDVVVHADAATCRRLRQWRQRDELAQWEEDQPPTEPAVTRLRERVIEQLAERISLPLLPYGPTPAGEALLGRLRAELPAPRVAAPLPAALPNDRPGLRALLREQGLGDEGVERIAAAAQIAIGLVPAPSGGPEPRTRLGGLPPLPAGMAWPQRTPERPLTPLAQIDFAELPPDAEQRELLPADGTLLLFADARDDEYDELIHDWRTNGDGWFLALHVPAGAPVAPVEPPALLRERPPEEGPGLLEPLPLVPRPLLTLPGGWNAARALGLDVGEQRVYARVSQLAFASRGEALAHLLGHPLPVQDDPRAEGEIALLALGGGSGGWFGIPGVEGLYVVVAADELRAGSFARARLVTDCG